MAGKRNRSKAPYQRGDQRENSNLQANLHGRGKTQSDETTDTHQIRLNGRAQQASAMLVVVPEQVAHKDRREIDARPGRGPARADGSHGRSAELAVDEEPVASGVDEVSGHKSKCDGANHAQILTAAPHGELAK